MNQLAILVPFRKRWRHLSEFVPHYTRRLPNARIFVIEQADEKQPFNRAKLLNVGFQHYYDKFTYFAAHDVDMLCTKGVDHYKFPPAGVAQLATHAQQFKYKMPFPEYLGGVTLFTNEFFYKIGGYSNDFWGYGGEDNEMYNHITSQGYSIEYRDVWYQSLYHPPSHPTGVDWGKMEQARRPRNHFDCLWYTHYEVVAEMPVWGATLLKVKI